MKKALFLYSSTDGQTIKILQFITDELKAQFEVESIDLHTQPEIDWQAYDRVLIGASIRYGHFNRALYLFIKNNLLALKKHRVAFFCVNLTARKPGKDIPQNSAYMRKFLSRSPWQPELMAVFAGALCYPRYKWFDRVMIQFIMRITGGETDISKSIEYTDWHKVGQFAQQFSTF